jgi:hypothetical protein
MDGLIQKVLALVDPISQGLFALVILLTIIAKLTPNKKDDEIASKAGKLLLKFFNFLPKFGVNPSTKKLEAAYEELKPSEDSKPS